MSGIALSRVIPDMSIQTNLFIHSFNIFLNQCENAKVHYWNAQMKAIDLGLIEEGSRQNENSRFLFRITRSYPIIALLLCKCCLASVLRTILPPHNNAFECMTLNVNQFHKLCFAIIFFNSNRQYQKKFQIILNLIQFKIWKWTSLLPSTTNLNIFF